MHQSPSLVATPASLHLPRRPPSGCAATAPWVPALSGWRGSMRGCCRRWRRLSTSCKSWSSSGSWRRSPGDGCSSGGGACFKSSGAWVHKRCRVACKPACICWGATTSCAGCHHGLASWVECTRVALHAAGHGWSASGRGERRQAALWCVLWRRPGIPVISATAGYRTSLLLKPNQVQSAFGQAVNS
jgi:hypothetical protein